MLIQLINYGCKVLSRLQITLKCHWFICNDYAFCSIILWAVCHFLWICEFCSSI